ncbi:MULTISPECIES: DNA damage-inducible protein I [Winslowiella]|uniref:DNA damage-inducible protein I n=1 Tax=Winslowiella TaxID=2997349 RepID=UPI0028BE51A5|nr:DNA damage-inducible protein I [Winslowiella toletana]WNN46016.1 DNA damage-inducible protein I [Winslowiella toletana]
MRVEVTVAKTTTLPAGALEALTQELTKRIDKQFPESDNRVSVRYASANNLSVLGAGKEQKDLISDILQETWESADDWFITD